MTVHVGCYPVSAEVKFYDDVKQKTKYKLIESAYSNEIEKVKEMFKEITSNIYENLGCACICLDNDYGNKIRKKIIEEGLKCGFKNVEIINERTANYLYAMSEIPYKPLNGNIVWMHTSSVIDVWQIIDQKAKYMGRWKAKHEEQNFEEIQKYKEGPDIIIYKDKDHDFINKTLERNGLKQSKKCQAFICDVGVFIAEGSLLKARIRAGDPVLASIDAHNFLCQKIILKMDQKEIMCFEKSQTLPINYSQEFIKESNKDVLNIVSGNETEHCKLPDYERIAFNFQVDENGIYYAIFKDFNDAIIEYLKKTNDKINIMNATELLDLGEISAESFNYTVPNKDVHFKSNLQAIGIDIGTSRCCAAVNRKNGINTVPLDNTGERLLPSYVAYDEKKVKCGKVVVSRLRYHSKSTIFDSKRMIGRKFNDIEIDENWNFTVNNENEVVQIAISGFEGKRKLTAEEVEADLLKHVKQKAEEFQGTNITKTVITVPAAFTESQKTATLKAAKLAGWNEIVLLPEPIAAAFAYFIDSTIGNNSNVLLFDLGGGTLDVCIFKIENDQIKILSNTGDTKLGGRNFDTILINYFKNLMNSRYGISMLKDKKYKLMLECQRFKEDLSSVLDCSLDVDEYDTTQQGNISISRYEFEKQSQSLLNKVKNTIMAALYTSNLHANTISNVLLVGGGSRMPMVKKLLLDMFPFAIHCCDEHPDEVVAIGAAYYAYHIFSK